MQVHWNSSLLAASNGVCRHGVLSPILFTIDLSCLTDVGVRCRWDGCFAGTVGYADDVSLPVPSPA